MIERATLTQTGVRKFCLLAIAISLAIPNAPAQTNAGPIRSAAQAETPAAKPPEYDVVSIKENTSGNGLYHWGEENNQFHATGVPLKVLLKFAYSIREDLISGISGPVASAHFDVDAKFLSLDPKLTDDQQRSMLQQVFAERFHLKVHTELKTLPVFELVVAKGGSKLKPSTGDGKNGSVKYGLLNGYTNVTANTATMAMLVDILSGQMNETVIDKTGLPDHYDFSLKWSNGDSNAPLDTPPAIFTAIQEQLGLKLQPAKGPVKTLIVDHAEMPSAN